MNLTRLGVDRQLLALGLSRPLVDTVLGFTAAWFRSRMS